MSPLERKIWEQYGPRPQARPEMRIVPKPVDLEAEWWARLSQTQNRRRFLIDRARDRMELGRSTRRFTPLMRTGGEIIIEVAEAHGLTAADLWGPSRNKHCVEARHEAVYRMAQETVLSFPQMARLLGDRDHTTILHGIRKHGWRTGVITLPRGLSWGRRANLQSSAERHS